MNKIKIRFFIHHLKFQKGNKQAFFAKKNKKFKLNEKHFFQYLYFFNMSNHSNFNFFKFWDFLFQLIH